MQAARAMLQVRQAEGTARRMQQALAEAAQRCTRLPTLSLCPAFMKPVMMVLKVEAVGRTREPGSSISWKHPRASSQWPTCLGGDGRRGRSVGQATLAHDLHVLPP